LYPSGISLNQPCNQSLRRYELTGMDTPESKTVALHDMAMECPPNYSFVAEEFSLNG
jgi:hypothetical protein